MSSSSRSRLKFSAVYGPFVLLQSTRDHPDATTSPLGRILRQIFRRLFRFLPLFGHLIRGHQIYSTEQYEILDPLRPGVVKRFDRALCSWQKLLKVEQRI